MSIGVTIKRLRREKDITQEQLAEYLGIAVLRSDARYETLVEQLKKTAKKR